MATRKPLLDPAAAAFVRGDPPVSTGTQEPQEEGRVRLTADLPKSLHRRLKQAALDREQPMTELVRQALGEWLAGQR